MQQVIQMAERLYSPPIFQRTKNIQFRLLGILPLLFFLFQAVHYYRIDELGHVLWMCNIGNLVLAIGFFFCNPMLIRVAFLWMIPGLIVWIVYVVLAWGIFLSSTLAHVGGVVVGLIGLRRVGMDRHTWFYALLWYFVMQIVSRLATPAKLNVNVAHAIEDGWRQNFDRYWKFWLVLTLVVAVILWLVGLLLAKAFPPFRVPSSNERTQPVMNLPQSG